ncbi:hypothetical protein [Paracoccus sp. AK26]|uniref:hypothetical protein n=1 Tax=Paracoccus sp. AK26 TaxID=2589076 RepID=UPI0014315184|nr:hypothetical protein [Paracoccus sp. AK26]
MNQELPRDVPFRTESLFRKGRGLRPFRNRLLLRNRAKRPRFCNRLHPQEK